MKELSGVLAPGHGGGVMLHRLVLELFEHFGRILDAFLLTYILYPGFGGVPVVLRRFYVFRYGRGIGVVGGE